MLLAVAAKEGTCYYSRLCGGCLRVYNGHYKHDDCDGSGDHYKEDINEFITGLVVLTGSICSYFYFTDDDARKKKNNKDIRSRPHATAYIGLAMNTCVPRNLLAKPPRQPGLQCHMTTPIQIKRALYLMPVW